MATANNAEGIPGILRIMVLAFAAGLAMKITAQKPIISPEVHADHTVTFRFMAPNAKKVGVGVEGYDEAEMVKDASGIWTYTTPALKPEIYGYSFDVDGSAALDPLNSSIKSNLIWLGNMVTVPGDPPEPWEVQDVPHGTLHHYFYKSKVIGDQRDLLVYTPPGYDGSTDKFPVLYLLHGYSDMANGWTAVGQAHVIMDNLIAEGKVKPMLVVMPLGYGVPNFASRAGTGFSNKITVKRNYSDFREGLIQEIIPYVENTYRVTDARAIAGLSMGGMESLFVALNSPTMFKALGAFSSGGFYDDPKIMFDKFDPTATNAFKPFYLSCGTEDGLIEPNRGMVKWLKSQGVTNLEAVEMPGRHTWMVWRKNLIDFTSAIFKD